MIYNVYMTKNIGTGDRIIRVIVALVLFFSISFFGNKIIQWVLLILSIVSLGTAIIGWCGLYKVFGINTCKIQ